MEDLKKQRTKEKSAVSRLRSKLERHLAERKKEEVLQCMEDLRIQFESFEKVHFAIYDQLEEPADVEACDNYLIEVQDKYSEVTAQANDWLATLVKNEGVKEEIQQVKDVNSSQSMSQGLLAALNLPKVELDCFSGDPLQYYSFMNVFEDTVEKVVEDGGTKLTRLLQYTSGPAKEAIRSCAMIGGEKGYELGKRILKEKFGNDLLISEKLMSSLKNGGPVKSATDLQMLSNQMTNCNVILTRMHRAEEINSQHFIAAIVDRMQPFQKNKWKREAIEMKRKQQKYPDFERLTQFVEQEAELATDPVYGDSGLLKYSRAQSSMGNQQQRSSHPSPGKSTGQQQSKAQGSATKGSSFASGKGRTVPPCVFCGQNHRLYMCDSFKALKAEQKYDVIVDKKLCENCLLDNHTVENCLRSSMCGINQCSDKHSRFIHSLKVKSDVKNSSVGLTNVQDEVCIPVVQVKVNNTVDSSALLDTCSTNTFCSQSLASRLKLKGVPVKFELSTLSNKGVFTETTLIPMMCVEAVDGQSLNLHNVHIVKEIPMKSVKLDVSKMSHLCDLPLQQDVNTVDLLIGQDNSEALVPLDVKKGGVGQPFAVKTVLGWSLHGRASNQSDFCGLVCGEKISKKAVCHFIMSGQQSESLEAKVNSMWEIEDSGLSDQYTSMSDCDKEVVQLWDEEVKVVDGHYELPIPWKPEVVVPDNYELAASRLKSLKSSLDKRGIFPRYDQEIKKLLNKGYAEVIPEDPETKPSKIWYLPHHGVTTEKKPDKLRVVYDCAAKFAGESLNDKCRQGPDLNNKLIHVLLRFRQHQFAITADIEAMYYQVKVVESDRDVLRFLWYDEEGNEVAYRMNAHVFGGVWCASIATYALRRTLIDQEVENDLVKDVIRRSFYVDDCLRSLQSPDEAKMMIDVVKDVLNKGGFNLTKFVASDPEILNQIAVDDRAKEVKQFSAGSSSKVLGIEWDVSNDSFHITVNITPKKAIARKDMLSIIASMYDPLGLVSPCIVEGKKLLQEATRMKLSWVDDVPQELSEKWWSWTNSLSGVKNLSFPRCVKTSKFDGATLELHTFCDASEHAYGCCSYVKCADEDGEASSTLIMSKGRISPIDYVTIPRLELQAAVMAAQVHSMLLKELDIHFARSYLWTDSQIVLAYIKNTDKRLKVYVANRVSTIRNHTDKDQWRFVPGKENPADHISRGMTPQQLMISTWKDGPEFLKHDVSEIQDEEFIIAADDQEVKKVVSNLTATVKEEIHPVDKVLQYSSSWYKAKRIICMLMKVKERFKNKKPISKITVQDLKEAEDIIIKHIQNEVYKKEIQSLKAHSKVQRSSSIRNLLPMLNEDDVMCVQGRLDDYLGDEISRHPPIIPYNHLATELIVRECHEQAHQGTEWTLSLLRRRYWITKARSIIKRVKKKCIVCKKLFGKPCTQQMANLPAERLEANIPPFTYVGIDAFGPFYIKLGRSEVKRYGLIFTCLNTRGIHIEKLNTMETDSFINAFRRFMSRRGTPRKVYSDNGTNFVGGCDELLKCMKIDEKKLEEYCSRKEVEWYFQPPHASHMGGIWERQIRSIRKILMSLLNKFSGDLKDEVLETLFCEIEAMINSRPLTKLNDDPHDMATLSPNQLLMLNQGPKNFPGNFQRKDMYKQRWRFIQYLANEFWKRWIKAYLPELQRRCKWFDKQVNVEVGNVVLLVEENTPRFLWPLGLVLEVKKGRDNLVRTVKVKTRSSELVRPVSKLVKLEEE